MLQLPPGVGLRIERLPHAAALELADLHDDDRERMDSFRSVARRRGFALGRATVRALLADWLGTDPAGVGLRVAADGALECPAGGLHVSLAHTTTAEAAVAAAVVAERPVGVDAEAIRPRHPELHRRFLRETEYPLIDQVTAERDHAVVTLWAIKEAVLKARRSGLRCSPKHLLVRLDGRQSGSVSGPGDERWTAAWCEAHGCVVAVATLASGRL